MLEIVYDDFLSGDSNLIIVIFWVEYGDCGLGKIRDKKGFAGVSGEVCRLGNQAAPVDFSGRMRMHTGDTRPAHERRAATDHHVRGGGFFQRGKSGL